jgi:outer membrane protein OmpA-like peptidoglycan-associated protein
VAPGGLRRADLADESWHHARQSNLLGAALMDPRGAWLGAGAAFALLVWVALGFAPESIQADIEARAEALLAADGWGRVVVSGRDLSLHGLAPDDRMAARALADLRALRGVRAVRDHSEVTALRLAVARPAGAPAPHARSMPDSAYSPRERNALARPLPAPVCQQLIDALLSRNTVNFDIDSALIRRDSVPLLEHLATAASHCPRARLQITGHTHDTGSRPLNLRLSEDRAAAVAEYLASRGVSRHRLHVHGAGAAEPVSDNATAPGRALNQRIEISLLPSSY